MSDTSGVVDLDSIVGSTAVVLLFCDEPDDMAAALADHLPWYEQQSVRVVLVTGGDTAAAVAAVGTAAPTVTDTTGELCERYWPGHHAWPATVVIGTDGSMVARVEGGAPEVHLERLREAVAAHVASIGGATTSS
jgi:hypothetical protein